MDRQGLKKIIFGFMNNHFSEEGNKLFYFWFRLKRNRQEKEDILNGLWNSDFKLIPNSTYTDWCKLKEIIEAPKQRKTISMYLVSAAVVIALLASISGIYLMNETLQTKASTNILSYSAMHGEQRTFILDDGTKVNINAGSMLLAPESFQNVNQRKVYLVGKAHFDVAHDASKSFVVHTAKMEVTALGTQFSVSSYFDEITTQAILEEGCIQVKVNDDNHSYIHTLKPQEKLIYNHLDSSVEIQKLNDEQISLCQHGYIVFENASFKDIINTIERQFNVVFQYDMSKYTGGLYYIKFSPNENLEDVLKILKELLDLKYTIKGRYIYLE